MCWFVDLFIIYYYFCSLAGLACSGGGFTFVVLQECISEYVVVKGLAYRCLM